MAYTPVTDFKTDQYYGSPQTPTNKVLKLATAISSSATSLTTNFEPVDKDGASITDDIFIGIRKSNGFVETMRVTAISGTTMTVVRGIRPNGLDLTTGDSSFADSHDAGEEIIFNIPAVSFQMLASALNGEIGSKWKLNGNPTYSGTGIMLHRVFADATARDAAITSPTNGMVCYQTDEGTLMQYIGGAWANAASGTTPNASETVTGKTQLTTDAQSVAGTDSDGGDPLVVKPSQVAANQQSGTFVSGTASGTDTYALTLTPALGAYGAGTSIVVTFTNANTGAATLNVNTLGARTIQDINGNALAAGAIGAGKTYMLIDDGTQFKIYNLPSASETIEGVVEKATDTEFGTGSDSTRYVTADQVRAVTVLQTTRDLYDASGTVSIAHGLSVIPKAITIFLRGGESYSSMGASDGTNHMCTFERTGPDNPPVYQRGNNASSCAVLTVAQNTASGGGSITQACTASFDATNVDLVWTKTDTAGTDPSDVTAYITILVHC